MNRKDLSMLKAEDFLSVVRKLSDDEDQFDSSMHIGRSMVLMRALLGAAFHIKEVKNSDFNLNDIKYYLELTNFLKLSKDESVVKNGYDAPIIDFLLSVPCVDCEVIKEGNFPERAKENYNHYKDYLLNLLNKI